MDEAQAWEQLYGRRSPDVRVIGRDADADPVEDERREGTTRGYVAAREDGLPPASEANAA
jgi:hypothetical protein